jgi:hypothetical protein
MASLNIRFWTDRLTSVQWRPRANISSNLTSSCRFSGFPGGVYIVDDTLQSGGGNQHFGETFCLNVPDYTVSQS